MASSSKKNGLSTFMGRFRKFCGKMRWVPGFIAVISSMRRKSTPSDAMLSLRAKGLVLFERPACREKLALRSEEHTSELQSLMRISYAVFCLKKHRKTHNTTNHYLLLKVST